MNKNSVKASELKIVMYTKEQLLTKEKSSEWILMTPDLAKAILELNINNRKKKDNYIRQMAQDMKDGKWEITGESIIMSYLHLNDGQNRLLATILANHTWKCNLVRGVSPKSQDSIDGGTKRSRADILSLNGVDKNLAPTFDKVSKFILQNKNGDKNVSHSNFTNTSVNKQLDYVKNNVDYLEKLNEICEPLYKDQEVKVYNKYELSYYLHKVSGGCNEKNGEIRQIHAEFIENLIFPKNKTASQHLRKRLSKLKKSNNDRAITGKEKFYAIVKCWNYYVQGNKKVQNITISDKEIEIKLI